MPGGMAVAGGGALGESSQVTKLLTAALSAPGRRCFDLDSTDGRRRAMANCQLSGVRLATPPDATGQPDKHVDIIGCRRRKQTTLPWHQSDDTGLVAAILRAIATSRRHRVQHASCAVLSSMNGRNQPDETRSRCSSKPPAPAGVGADNAQPRRRFGTERWRG